MLKDAVVGQSSLHDVVTHGMLQLGSFQRLGFILSLADTPCPSLGSGRSWPPALAVLLV
jgi:hypothetical protein